MGKDLKNNELNNVSGGGGGGTPSEVYCTNCKKNIMFDKALVRTETGTCGSTHYFKCPKCNYEWHD